MNKSGAFLGKAPWRQVLKIVPAAILAGLMIVSAFAQNSTPQPSEQSKADQSAPPAKQKDAQPTASQPSKEDAQSQAPPSQSEAQPASEAKPTEPAAQQSTSPQSKTETPKPALSGAELRKEAWKLIHQGISDKSNPRRAAAVKSLALLKGESRAVSAAIAALDDKSPDVRSAGALALGELQDTSTIPKLKDALSDKEPKVVLAAAHSLVQMKDPAGYDIYYSIVSGQRKSGKGLIAGQLDTFKDPKKLAVFGFEEGIGYVPFAGIGYAAVKTIMKDDGAPGRAAAARALEHDPDPESVNALSSAAVGDKNELVRVAALETLSKRNDPAAIEGITPAMYDDKDSVKFTAAAAILHLSDVRDQGEHQKKPHSSKRRTAKSD